MSYDLFFSFAQVVQRCEVERYFADRSFYTVEGAAVYQNPDTGVYFSFELRGEEADANRLMGVAFNLNYFRPHVFGLEAEPEVHAFVQHFNPLIEDPQMHGMGQGPYSSAGFFSGWNAGNAFGYRAITANNKGPFLSYPENKVEAVWRWNKAKRALQPQYGDTVFVPTVMLATVDGHVQSLVVWGDGIPTLMPRTDAVLVVRDRLAPQSLFRLKKGKDHCLVASDDLDVVLGSYAEHGHALPVRVPNYLEPGQDVVRWVRQLKAFIGDLKLVRMDQVLSQELLEDKTLR